MKSAPLIVWVLLAGILVPTFGDSVSNEQHGGSVEAVLEEIRASLELGPQERIDPGRVEEEMLEELGEALMSQMVADAREHAWMDDMMGGEGSDTLASMHRFMGYRYLSGYGGARGRMGMMGPTSGGMMMGGFGMMGPGMMGPGMMGPYRVNEDWLEQERSRAIWGAAVPWTIASLLSVAVAALSVVIATR